MDLHTAGHRRGVVCAPHSAAAEAGRAVLADGGNALEAMVAMAASIAVVYPHMNGIGGDGFWLVREPSGRMRALMAAGRAGENARPELYREYEAIPSRGPLAALTVPGAIGGWMLALEAAKAMGGVLPLTALLGHAVRQAGEGTPVARSLANLTAAVASELKPVSGFAETFLVDGKAPAIGDVLKQPALAATLEQLVHAGLADFYRGDVAREVAADLDRVGAPVTRADLARHKAYVAEPLAVEIDAGTLYNTPPPTQGLAALMILALFQRLGVREAEGFDHVHGLIEAAKRALRVRDRVIADPERMAEPPERFLAAAFLDAEAAAIDRRKAVPFAPSSGQGDTIWMGAADASGLVVSYIQSLYWEFGSGVVLPRTGVLMQNRGTGFNLKPASRNCVEPGKLPPHTLNPALAVLRDGRIMAYGTMGGDAQPQIQAALFTRHVLFRQPLEQALDRPRWFVGRTWGSAHGSVMLEGRFDGNLIDRLVSAGHDIDVMAAPYAGNMGHAGAVVLHSNGTLEGAHDPRADGGATGI
jgi:gamma-glutamyltranspeptidase/glutathione hydrolase